MPFHIVQLKHGCRIKDSYNKYVTGLMPQERCMRVLRKLITREFNNILIDANYYHICKPKFISVSQLYGTLV